MKSLVTAALGTVARMRVEHLAIFLDRVAAFHPPQHVVRAALGRHVQIRRALRQIAHGREQIVGHVFRKIRDELQPGEALDVVQSIEQIGQPRRSPAVVMAIAVHRLAQAA